MLKPIVRQCLKPRLSTMLGLREAGSDKFLNFTKQTIQHSRQLHAGIGQLCSGVREQHAGF